MASPNRVLFTNFRLADQTGTELYIRDVAGEIRSRGWDASAFSPRLGALAEDIRGLTIPVSDDLDTFHSTPSVIHGQHHFPTLRAMLAFPEAPAVYFCHGWRPWEERPPVLPRIRRYVAIDTATRDRVVEEGGIDPDRVRIIPNFVDLKRFKPRWPLPEWPERVAIFSSYVSEGSDYYRAVSTACERLGMDLDVIGSAFGTEISEPETALQQYDLVFAQGRSALEAITVGAAVMVTSSRAFGPLVTSQNLDELREQNFGICALNFPVDVDHVVREIERYDANDAAETTIRLRESVGLTGAVDAIEEVYREAIEEHRQAPVDGRAERSAIARYLGFLGERLEEVSGLERRVAALEEKLSGARALSKERGRVIRRMERTRAWRIRNWLRGFGSRKDSSSQER